jgi:hypothetical protein
VGAEGGAVIIHRYYDPDTGRYLTPDPLAPITPSLEILEADGVLGALIATGHDAVLEGAGIAVSATYGYGRNNPLTFVDPSGLDPKCTSKSKGYGNRTDCGGADKKQTCRDAFPDLGYGGYTVTAQCVGSTNSGGSLLKCKFCPLHVCE